MGIISVGFGASGLPLWYLTRLGVIRMGDGDLEFRSSDEGGGCGGYACSGLISLHLKITLVDELFTISRSWLTLGVGESLQGQQDSEVKASESRKQKTQLTPWLPRRLE